MSWLSGDTIEWRSVKASEDKKTPRRQCHAFELHRAALAERRPLNAFRSDFVNRLTNSVVFVRRDRISLNGPPFGTPYIFILGQPDSSVGQAASVAVYLARLARRSSLHQDVEAGLFEMVVAGQGVAQAVVFHDGKRDAIGQRLQLVRPLVV
jgi:hypothetical protein